jgi:hypothetical protein
MVMEENTDETFLSRENEKIVQKNYNHIDTQHFAFCMWDNQKETIWRMGLKSGHHFNSSFSFVYRDEIIQADRKKCLVSPQL